MKFKNILITALKFIFSLVFLIALIMVAWSLFTSMVKVFGDQTKTVEPTIAVAIISALGAIIVNAISKHSERKNQEFIRTKEKMTKEYELFLKDFNESTEEKRKDILLKFHSTFAVNSSSFLNSPNGPHGFCQQKTPDIPRCRRIFRRKKLIFPPECGKISVLSARPAYGECARCIWPWTVQFS